VNNTLDSKAIEFGESIRQTLHEADGSPQLHAYVNYAHGDETLQEMYGYDAWRVRRLKSLKEKYDPHGRFNFFAPL
jgi:FAD/FMN-containing dehydrogenase